MTQVNPPDPASTTDAKLPRRDWILLPLLSLLTIALLAVSTELISRRVFYESRTLSRCMILDDPATGVRGISNSVCWEKAPESDSIEYRFDGCGYRSSAPCGPKVPGSFRIVMTGSSFAMGALVPIDKSLAVLLPAKLSQKFSHKIEVYSEGLGLNFARNTALRFDDVLTVQPDMILWVLSPLDIKMAAFPNVETHEEIPDPTESDRLSPGKASAKEWMKNTMSRYAGAIESGYLLRHFLYEHESQSQYIQSYLLKAGGDRMMGINGDANFLRADLNPQWKAHLREFDGYAAEICGKAKAAGIPVVAVLVPNRAQAAMISMGEWPAGYDPFKLDNELRAILTRRGATYLDILPEFRNIPNPEKGYFPVDGHLNAKGYAMIAEALSYKMTSNAIPALKTAEDPLNGLAQDRDGWNRVSQYTDAAKEETH